jgi:hypothetical protein
MRAAASVESHRGTSIISGPTSSRQLLADLITGRVHPDPRRFGERVWRDATDERVQFLVAEALLQSGREAAGFRALARSHLAAAEARRVLWEQDIRRVLARLAEHGVRPVLIKGAALAYTHYARPHLRPRLDTDLLIDERDVVRAREAFASLGGGLVPLVTGRLVMPQFQYETSDATGCVHVYDVHFKVAVPPRFSRALEFAEISTGSVAIPSLAEGARAPSAIHALLLACVHRAAHHRSGGPLIWLHDVHLIADRLSPLEQQEVASLAAARGLVQVVLDMTGDAYAAFGGERAARLCSLLTDARQGMKTGDVLLGSRRTRVGAALDDLRALGWRDRAELFRELLLPRADYMRGTYAPGSRVPLPVLYLRRIVRGAWNWSRS